MACFLVPAAEAVVISAAYIAAKKKEQKIVAPAHAENKAVCASDVKITWSKRLGWLMALLWGGVLLLAFEHFWHGEVVPFPPFLTAMADPNDKAEMLHEMSTVGVSMAVMVTAFWGVLCGIAQAKVAKIRKSLSSKA